MWMSVNLSNGTRWVASFFTYESIRKLTEKNEQTGENLSGKYFWSSDMILVDEVSRERIEELVEHFLVEGDLYSLFDKCQDDEADDGF